MELSSEYPDSKYQVISASLSYKSRRACAAVDSKALFLYSFTRNGLPPNCSCGCNTRVSRAFRKQFLCLWLTKVAKTRENWAERYLELEGNLVQFGCSDKNVLDLIAGYRRGKRRRGRRRLRAATTYCVHQLHGSRSAVTGHLSTKCLMLRQNVPTQPDNLTSATLSAHRLQRLSRQR